MIWHRVPAAGLAPGAGGPGGPGLAASWPDRRSAVAPPSVPLPDEKSDHRDLHDALVAFRDAHPAGVYSAARMISPLLDLWALVAAVDRTAARPIEMELITLVEREVVTSRELCDCTVLVEVALLPLTRQVYVGGNNRA